MREFRAAVKMAVLDGQRDAGDATGEGRSDAVSLSPAAFKMRISKKPAKAGKIKAGPGI